MPKVESPHRKSLRSPGAHSLVDALVVGMLDVVKHAGAWPHGRRKQLKLEWGFKTMAQDALASYQHRLYQDAATAILDIAYDLDPDNARMPRITTK